jgi:protein-S-isoprenylcysteine O-methyltransferase Ste14
MPPHNRTGKRSQHRSDLTGEHRFGDRGQIIFACLFAAVWVSDSFFLNYSTFPNQYLLLSVRIPIGITLLVLAAYLAGKGLSIVFGDKNRKPSVIQKSVFSVVRHPIYLAEILLYLGLLVLNMSLAALGIWIGAIIFLHYISRYEEKLLVERFGEEYKQYMRRVPMWIPRIRRSRS